MLGHVGKEILSFFRNLPKWFWTSYLWPLLAIPAIFMLAIYLLAYNDFLGWGNSRVHKAQFEVAHPVILAFAMIVAIAGRIKFTDTSLTFLAVMCGFCLFRELYGQGSSDVLYLGLLGLIAYARLQRTKLNTLVGSRIGLSYVATGFLTYAASQILDRGLIDRIGRLITDDPIWRVPYHSQIEESSEALGGFFILLAVVQVLNRARRT